MANHDASSVMGSMTTLVVTVVSIAAIAYGWSQRQEYWISPEYGLGYWLGIVGSVMMAVLLFYPLRKKMKLMRGFFSVKSWFRWHMIFGVFGPVLILYHCNFQLGATNSNVALFCMILVVLSGVVGRYVYQKYNDRVLRYEKNFRRLRRKFDARKKSIYRSGVVSSGLKSRLVEMERKFEQDADSLTTNWKKVNRLLRISKGMMRQIKIDMKQARANRMDSSRIRKLRAVRKHVLREFAMLKKLEKYTYYSQLFSVWHLLHFPLFIMLILAAVAHIIAVHMY